MENKLTWKDLREKTGKTISEMAECLGMSRQLYQMKETYKRPMRVEEAVEISRLSHTDLSKVKLK